MNLAYEVKQPSARKQPVGIARSDSYRLPLMEAARTEPLIWHCIARTYTLQTVSTRAPLLHLLAALCQRSQIEVGAVR